MHVFECVRACVRAGACLLAAVPETRRGGHSEQGSTSTDGLRVRHSEQGFVAEMTSSSNMNVPVVHTPVSWQLGGGNMELLAAPLGLAPLARAAVPAPAHFASCCTVRDGFFDMFGQRSFKIS